MSKFNAIETTYGILFGRDAIFLDDYSSKIYGDLVLRGEINCTLASKPPEGKWCQYELRFKGVVAARITELDTFESVNAPNWPVSSFDEVLGSDWKSSLLGGLTKVEEEHKVYVLKTYDWVFEVICNEYTLIFGDERDA